MFFCPIVREQLLTFMPPGGEIAEIGVAEGRFSRIIYNTVKPDHLHLIDPWAHQPRADYNPDPANVSDQDQEGRYQGVAKAMSAEIAAKKVTIHREYSVPAADKFKDGRFDWIYLDAMHTKEAVSADLAAWHRKVKPGGFIVGDDYANHPMAQQMNFGVVEAVDEFVLKNGYHFLILTKEMYHNYVLAKSLDSEQVRGLLRRLVYNLDLIEIRDFPGPRRFSNAIIRAGDKTKAIPSF